MKLLLDFLPLILFFATFRYADKNADWAAGFASEHFGFLVSGGSVGAKEAPVLLATAAIGATSPSWLARREVFRLCQSSLREVTISLTA